TYSKYSEVEKDHGRIETRNVFSIGKLEEVDGLGLEKWPSILTKANFSIRMFSKPHMEVCNEDKIYNISNERRKKICTSGIKQ
ncbi:MAG: hypothetical protein FWG71_03950, partial [Synergistaceae bacterium]|nr:hypothetical protein [Synergistaceae bacterium]